MQKLTFDSYLRGSDTPVSRSTLFSMLAAVCLLIGCGKDTEPGATVEIQGVTMGTLYTIKLVEPPPRLDSSTVRIELDELLDGINARMSTYLPDSELSRFNVSRETDWIEASKDLVEVMQAAQDISVETGGAFDVTVGPLVNLWGFGPQSGAGTIPAQDRIREVMTRVGHAGLAVRSSPPAIRKHNPDLYVDLSAIAKGYAVDRIAAYLETQGGFNYMVEVGGEIRVRGKSARGSAWRIAVEKPLDDARVVHSVLELRGGGLATSGDYRNYFEQTGRRYSHTIDPRSGYPVSHTLASVTVVDSSAMRADAMATALMVLGPDAGYAFAERIGLAALFVIKHDDGFVDRVTPAFLHYQVVNENRE